MLPRAFVLLVAIGVVAAAAERPYNTQTNYGQDYSKDGRYGTNQNYNRNNQDQRYNQQGYNSGSDQAFGQNRNQDNRHQESDWQYERDRDRSSYRGSNLYVKNQTAIFCYVNGTRTSRNNYHSEDSFNMLDIDAKSCTHLIVGAAMIHPNSHVIHAINSEFSQDALRDKNRDLKILVSVSGNARDFATMAGDPNHRTNFVNSIKTFLTLNRLDGINIDWQWPVGARDSYQTNSNKNNYIEFLKLLRNADRSKLVTVFIPPENAQIADIFENFENFEKDMIDFYILMALEMRGHNYQKIEHHAPIDSYTSAQTVRKAINTIQSVVPRSELYKFVLAIPFYGKRYQLESRSQYADESPINRPFSRQHSVYPESRTASYSQICREMASTTYRRGYDKKNECPYAVHDATVYVYEDTESVRAKTRLALQNGFGGVMAFSIEMDDTSGQCRDPRKTDDRRETDRYYSDKYPLLRAIYDQVQRGNAAMFHSSPLAIAFAVVCALILKVNN